MVSFLLFICLFIYLFIYLINIYLFMYYLIKNGYSKATHLLDDQILLVCEIC